MREEIGEGEKMCCRNYKHNKQMAMVIRLGI